LILLRGRPVIDDLAVLGSGTAATAGATVLRATYVLTRKPTLLDGRATNTSSTNVVVNAVVPNYREVTQEARSKGVRASSRNHVLVRQQVVGVVVPTAARHFPRRTTLTTPPTGPLLAAFVTDLDGRPFAALFSVSLLTEVLILAEVRSDVFGTSLF
jgi:hypothetical protein